MEKTTIAEKKPTTVQLHMTTQKRLKEIGTMGSTYDDVVNEVLDFWDAGHRQIYFKKGDY